jgi:hypothetical protein
MNVNGKNGKQFVYREMGVEWLVTQLEHAVNGDKHEFKFRVDHIIRSGGMPVPNIGHVTSVMYTEGHEHYAGWSVEEAEEDPFEEREFPLRKGSVIRSSEGILFSRLVPGMIPITSCAEEEIDAVLDAYGDALDRIDKLQEMADKAVGRSLERRDELVGLNNYILETFGSIEINETPRDEIVLKIAALLDRVRKTKTPATRTEEEK